MSMDRVFAPFRLDAAAIVPAVCVWREWEPFCILVVIERQFKRTLVRMGNHKSSITHTSIKLENLVHSAPNNLDSLHIPLSQESAFIRRHFERSQPRDMQVSLPLKAYHGRNRRSLNLPFRPAHRRV
jgi:hypothetical protein